MAAGKERPSKTLQQLFGIATVIEEIADIAAPLSFEIFTFFVLEKSRRR